VHRCPPRAPANLASFVSASKLDPEMLATWAGLLSESSESSRAVPCRGVRAPHPPPPRLWLLAVGDAAGGRRWCDRVRAEVAARGVHPSRVQCRAHAPKEAYVRWYARVDLFLDTRLYGAHTTAADALRYGTPVLTLEGDRFANRVGASLLAAMDYAGAPAPAPAPAAAGAAAPAPLPPPLSFRAQLLTHSLKAYHAQAATLAGHRWGVRAALKAQLLLRDPTPSGTGTSGTRAAAAFDYAATAAKLERAYRAMWEVRAATGASLGGGGRGGLVIAPGG
jgi:hypothetical protein